MSNMLKEAAMQQALEALEYTIKPLCMCWAGCENCDPSKAPDIEKAITDLRAALAQEPEPVSAADLVQRIRELRDEAAKMFIESGSPGYKLHDLYRMKLDAILVAPLQQPEPAQEPAFHGFMSDDGTRVDVCFTPSSPRTDGTYATAYYTAPQPQRKPLTDEEILRAAINACDSLHITRAIYAGGGRKTICDDAGLLEICRAIERAVREEA